MRSIDEVGCSHLAVDEPILAIAAFDEPIPDGASNATTVLEANAEVVAFKAKQEVTAKLCIDQEKLQISG